MIETRLVLSVVFATFLMCTAGLVKAQAQETTPPTSPPAATDTRDAGDTGDWGWIGILGLLGLGGLAGLRRERDVTVTRRT
jgi:MYXO-CTERM domain-containing protein